MRTRVKIAVGVLAFGALVFGFLIVDFFQFPKAIDASKEDPQLLFTFYVQKQPSPSIKVYSASGHVYPFTGTRIVFRFHIGQKDLDDLIASKRLDKEDSLQGGLFAAQDLAELKHPEYYATDRDTTWSSLRSDVRMAVDRDSGIVLYMVRSQ